MSLIVLATFGQSAKRLAADGWQAYENGNFKQADSLYTAARLKGEADFALTYNAALTKLQLAHTDSARVFFERSLLLPDSLPALVQYNLGNLSLMEWARKSLELEEVEWMLEEASATQGLSVEERLEKYLEKDSLLVRQKELLDGKVKSLETAINHYKTTLLLDATDDDARYNLLYARGKIPPPPEEKNDPSPEDKKDDQPQNATREKEVKGKAFEYIQQGQFNQAYRYLQRELSADPDLKSLESLLENLGVILNILEQS